MPLLFHIFFSVCHGCTRPSPSLRIRQLGDEDLARLAQRADCLLPGNHPHVDGGSQEPSAISAPQNGPFIVRLLSSPQRLRNFRGASVIHQLHIRNPLRILRIVFNFPAGHTLLRVSLPVGDLDSGIKIL